MKIKILFFILFFVIFTSSTSASECKYLNKFYQCDAAIKSFIWKSNSKLIWVWGSLKDFTDFPCIQDSEEARIFQIAVDENFKEIDKEMDEYLKNLFESKNYYFWKEKNNNYIEWIEHIFLKKDEFQEKYNEACRISFMETADCTKNLAHKDPKEQASISVVWALDFINWQKNSWSCFSLAWVKSNIFLEVAYNWLLLNRQQVSKDMQKQYVQTQRENYWKVLEAMRLNQSYIERINSQWTSKTKHTLNSR